MFTITISGPVVVTDDATDKPITDAKRLQTFDGLSSGRETCSKYHHGELADLELKGGAVKLVFDSTKKKLRVVSEFTSSRKLTKEELRALVDDTQGQWSDGIGEGCFDSVMDKRKVFIDLSPDSGGKVKATQTDDGKPAPKKSPAKVASVALGKAIAAGDLAKVKELVEAKANLNTRGQYGYTPLIAAIANDHLEVALYLIEQGADVTLADNDRDTPLLWAALRADEVKRHQNVQLAEAILDAGAEVNAHNRGGVTPLMLAAGSGAAKLVELLLARGADVKAKTTGKHNGGCTALMYASGIAVVRVLLDAGADPKAVDDEDMHTWDHHKGAAAKLLKEKAGVK